MLSLSEIKARVSQMASQIHAEEWALPTYGVSDDSARSHIECKHETYGYVVVERGQELSRFSTGDIDELLYWVFADVSHQLAFAYELKNRISGQDCRRLAFAKQLELLGTLNPFYARCRASEIVRILARAPFRDSPPPSGTNSTPSSPTGVQG